MFVSRTAPLPARNELVVSGELERDLGPEAPLHRRLRAVKDVGEKALHVRVQEVSTTPTSHSRHPPPDATILTISLCYVGVKYKCLCAVVECWTCCLISIMIA